VESDAGLNSCVRQIRKALGDDAHSPRFLETLARVGYRFIAPVDRLTAPAPVSDPGTASRRFVPRWGIAGIALALALGVGAMWLGNGWPSKAERIDRPLTGDETVRVVVLPFVRVGQAERTSTDEVSLGVTDELISTLAAHSWASHRLRVVGLTSALRFRPGQGTLDEVRLALHPDYVVEGSVRGDVTSLRVSVRLLDTPTATVVWSDSFELRPSDGSTTLASIADRVVGSMLSDTEQAPPAVRIARPMDPEARLSYLGARAELRSEQVARAERAEELLRRAVILAPHDGVIRGGLAKAHLLQNDYEEARTAAETAIRLGAPVVEPYDVLANVALMWDWNWDKAERLAQRAIEMAPSAIAPRRTYSLVLSSLGRHEEAIREILLALNLDPLSADVRADTGQAHFWARRFDEALRYCREALEIDPSSPGGGSCAVHASLALGRVEDAAAHARPLLTFIGVRDTDLPGPATPARDVVRQLWDGIIRWRLDNGAEHAASVPYVQIGEYERALYSLELALQRHSWYTILLAQDSRFDPLRGHPRFEQLLTRVGFPREALLPVMTAGG
jgi:TolB-like protein/Flp pilus assembly protein TadD